MTGTVRCVYSHVCNDDDNNNNKTRAKHLRIRTDREIKWQKERFRSLDLRTCSATEITRQQRSYPQDPSYGRPKSDRKLQVRAVFLNRRAAARYRALASIIPGRERPEETTIYYKISLVQWLITNLNVILYLSTCHTVYISVLILFIIMP
jgi:hypothetical protein